jgi:hypothetical protein
MVVSCNWLTHDVVVFSRLGPLNTVLRNLEFGGAPGAAKLTVGFLRGVQSSLK